MKLIGIAAIATSVVFGTAHAECDGVLLPIEKLEGKHAFLCFSGTGNDYIYSDGHIVTKPEAIKAAYVITGAYNHPNVVDAVQIIQKELK